MLPTLAGRGLCHSVLKAITLNVACLKYCSSPTPGLTLPLRLWGALTQAHSFSTTGHKLSPRWLLSVPPITSHRTRHFAYEVCCLLLLPLKWKSKAGISLCLGTSTAEAHFKLACLSLCSLSFAFPKHGATCQALGTGKKLQGG